LQIKLFITRDFFFFFPFFLFFLSFEKKRDFYLFISSPFLKRREKGKETGKEKKEEVRKIQKEEKEKEKNL
jgi:hypothetical protein